MKVYVVLGLTSDGYGDTVYSHVETVFSTAKLAQKFIDENNHLIIVECELDFVESEE